MDKIDSNVSSTRSPSVENELKGSSEPSEKGGTAKINGPATANYLKMLSRDRGLLPEGLSRTLTSVQSTLNEYLNNPASLEKLEVNESQERSAVYKKLSTQVISRDSKLQERVAQSLSSSHRLVRSRDAADALSQGLDSLPSALKEGTKAGTALSKFICESLVDLTDHSSMGAGLERDLAVRNVFAPQSKLSPRSLQATDRALSTTLAYVESNNPQVLAKITDNTPKVETPGTTTPQIMTRYLRKALDEFPDDSTYLDIFKQNRARTKDEPFQDKISKETADRIHNLISRAAETARKGNLLQSQGTSAQAAPETAPQTQAAGAQSAKTTPAAAADNRDGRELSIAELSARAARLQQQFREERMKLAAETKVPEQSPQPQVKTPPVKEQSTPISTPAPKAEAAAAATKPDAFTLAALNRATVSISYEAVQGGTYGGVNIVPGLTLPVSDFGSQSLGSQSMVQDFNAPKTMEAVLREQQRFMAQEQSAPEQPQNNAQTAPAENPEKELNLDALKSELKEEIRSAVKDAVLSDVRAGVKEVIDEARTQVKEVAASLENSARAIKESAAQSQQAAEALPLQVAEPEPEPEQVSAPLQPDEAVTPGAEENVVPAAVTGATPAAAAPAEQTAAAGTVPAEDTALARRLDLGLNARSSEVASAPASQPPAAQSAVTGEQSANAAAVAQVETDTESEIAAEVKQPAVAAAVEDTAAVPEETEVAAVESSPAPAVTVVTAATVTAQAQESSEPQVQPQTAAQSAATLSAAERNVLNAAQSLESPVTTAPVTEQITAQSASGGTTSAQAPGQAAAPAAGGEDLGNKLFVGLNQEAAPAAADEAQSSVGAEIMKGTVPSFELDDSDTPEDAVRREPLLKTSQEQPHEESALSAPGAAAITQGGAAPMPEKSVVENDQTVRESGLFHRLASLFTHHENEQEAAAVGAAQTSAELSATQNTATALKGTPVDNMFYALRVQSSNPNLPPEIREMAEKFIKALQDPVSDLTSVSNWLNFSTGPLSPSSPQAMALHQWAFFLLCLRFRELGKSVDKFLSKTQKDLPKLNIDAEVDSLFKDNKGKTGSSISDLLEETLGQVGRLQQLSEQHQGQPFARFIPLPPSYDGGREGGFAVKRESEDGQESWHLNFTFDLQELGPIELKAVARLPEIKISVVAETLAGLQKVQENLPKLEQQLAGIGIQTTACNSRMGRISQHESRTQDQPKSRNDGSTLSFDV